MAEMQTIDEMRETYKDEWVFVVDCEDDEAGWLLRGRVVAHSPRRDDVRKAMLEHPAKSGAIRCFREIPADMKFML